MFNQQKKYFRKKLHSVQCSIYDMQFKLFKTKEIREETRHEYDLLKSKREQLILRIKLESEKKYDDPSKLNKDEFARLEDQKTILDRDIKRKEEGSDDPNLQNMVSLRSLDMDILAEQEQLGALQSLKVMIKDYIKKL